MTERLSSDMQSGALIYHSHPRPGKTGDHAPPSRSATSAIWRWPIRPASPRPASRSPPIRPRPPITPSAQNLVAVVTNGTAVLGLGDIGPLAAKPVMEGKAVLFKKFAGIDVFDIEIAAHDVDKLVDAIAALEPTFGGINLEDIKAPGMLRGRDAQLRERMKIPVFHDDQHGTAIIVGAAVRNGLAAGRQEASNRPRSSPPAPARRRWPASNLLVALGARRENIFVTDIEGVVYKGRNKLMDPLKETFAQETSARTLAEVIAGADVFLGLSAGGVLKPEMVKTDGADAADPRAGQSRSRKSCRKRRWPCAPTPCCAPGRSDYPNQVNNVLCFPYIFRGALDVGATTINEAMKLAAVDAIAALARETPSEVVARAYGGVAPVYRQGFADPLALRSAPDPAHRPRRGPGGDGKRRRQPADRGFRRLSAKSWSARSFRSGFIMKPLMLAGQGRAQARGLCRGRGRARAARRAVGGRGRHGPADPDRPPRRGREADQDLRPRARPDRDFDLVDPENDPRYNDYVATLLSRRGPPRHQSRPPRAPWCAPTPP